MGEPVRGLTPTELGQVEGLIAVFNDVQRVAQFALLQGFLRKPDIAGAVFDQQYFNRGYIIHGHAVSVVGIVK